MELEINGLKYAIEEVGDGFQYYKIIDGKKEIPTPEELAQLLAKLKELNTKSHTKDEIKELINSAIDNNELTDINSIQEYLTSLGVTEDLEEFIEYAKEVLASKNSKYTLLDEIKDKVLKTFDEVKNNDKKAFVSFERKKSIIGEDFLEIHLSTMAGDQVYEQPNLFCAYNDETRKQLIEPVIENTALKSKVIQNNAVAKTDTMDFTADYHCRTRDNQSISVKNIEQTYAHELEKKLNELSNQYGSNLSEEEVQEVEEKQIGDAQTLERSDEMKLVRKKDQKGFANSIIAFVIAEVVAVLLLVFTLLELL